MITAFVEKNSVVGEIIEIKDKTELNHMKNSFRLQVGDSLRIVDGEYEYFTEIIELSKNEMICKIIEKKEDSFSTKVEIHAGIGLLKNDKMELVIQKLVEVGVSKIIPVQMQRTIVKINEKKREMGYNCKRSFKAMSGGKINRDY